MASSLQTLQILGHPSHKLIVQGLPSSPVEGLLGVEQGLQPGLRLGFRHI